MDNLPWKKPKLSHKFKIVEEVSFFGNFSILHANKRDPIDIDLFAGCFMPENFATKDNLFNLSSTPLNSVEVAVVNLGMTLNPLCYV